MSSEILSPVLIAEFFRSYKPKTIEARGTARAAVLVPFFMNNGILHLLLTQRTQTVAHHKGEVSFPGGMFAETDNSLIETAVREAKEEIGLSPETLSILGIFDDHRTFTGFVLTPVVALLSDVSFLTPNPAEVDEILTIPASFFLQKCEERSFYHPFDKKEVPVYYYYYQQHQIWGATAAIARNILRACTGA